MNLIIRIHLISRIAQLQRLFLPIQLENCCLLAPSLLLLQSAVKCNKSSECFTDYSTKIAASILLCSAAGQRTSKVRLGKIKSCLTTTAVEHCQSLLKEKEGRRRIAAEVKKTCQLDLFQAGSTVFLDHKKSSIFRKQFLLHFGPFLSKDKLLNFRAKTEVRIFQIFEIAPNSKPD